MNPSSKIIKWPGVFTVVSLLMAGVSFAQSADDAIVRSGNIAGLVGFMVGAAIGLIAGILVIAGCWKVFVKAGQPGWASIIPVYSGYILCKIVGKPGWWVILLCIPPITFIIWIIISLDLAKSFGKSTGFAAGLVLLPFIFLPMLGFGDAAYMGPAGA